MDVVFDFDGVLCEYKGWRGHDDIGKPIKEMVGLVKKLYKRHHTLKLSTTRLNPYPFGTNDKVDEEVFSGKASANIRYWLKKQGIEHCFSEITGYKPFGDYYIDDRGLRYAGVEKDNKGGLLGVELYQLLLKGKEELP